MERVAIENWCPPIIHNEMRVSFDAGGRRAWTLKSKVWTVTLTLVCQSASCHHKEIVAQKIDKGERMYFGSWFWTFKSKTGQLHWSGPLVRAAIMVERPVRASQEAERDWEAGVSQSPVKACFQWPGTSHWAPPFKALSHLPLPRAWGSTL